MTRLREAKALTQGDLVFALYERGVRSSVQSVSSWEAGRYAPSSRSTVAALDDALDGGGELLALLDYGSDSIEARFAALKQRVAALEDAAAAPAPLQVAADRVDGRPDAGARAANRRTRPTGRNVHPDLPAD